MSLVMSNIYQLTECADEYIVCIFIFNFVLLELRDRFSTKVLNGQMHIFKMDRTIKSWGDGWVKAGPMQSMASVACNYNVFI